MLTLKFNVAALSHPCALVKCAICEPEVLKVKPFQLYGNSLEQTDKLVVELLAVLIVRFKVTKLSQPPALV